MRKHAVKLITKCVLFTVDAILLGMLSVIELLAMTAVSGASGDPIQPKAIWVVLAVALVMIGDLYILKKIWEWEV